MVDKKGKSGLGRFSFSLRDHAGWNHLPSPNFKFTLKLLPIALLIVIGFSLGLSNKGTNTDSGQSVIENRGGAYKAQLRDAYAFIIAENYSEAADIASGVAQIDPENPVAYMILGLAYAHRGLGEEASTSLNHAVEIDPDFDLAWYNLGVVEESRGNFEPALDDYNHARELEPDNKPYLGAFSRVSNAIINATASESPEAESENAFLTAITALNRGSDEDFAFAENIFRSLIDDKPYDVAYKNMLALTLAREGRQDEAERILMEVVEAEPGYSDAWYNLGMIRESMGQIEEAQHDFEMAYNSSSLDSFREIAKSEMDRISGLPETETNATPTVYNTP
ncbi:MAG: tetratricopeptide repeat protein [bacterium]|nr:tetratricopeptide repeat protein [bacterium]